MDFEIKEKTKEPNMIVFTRQTYSPLQKDIFTLAVSQLKSGFNVQPDLFQNQTIRITTEMLNEVSEKNYGRLRSEAQDMQTKPIQMVDEINKTFDFIIPFPRIKYSKGVLTLTMFADVAASFLELQAGYSEFYIKESLSLEQFNKKRLYEMFSAYKKRNCPTWKVYDDELKFLLGMESQEYKGRPKEFGTKIVGICVNAINDRTSLIIKYYRKKDVDGWFTFFTIDEKTRPENNISKVDAPRFTPDRIDKNNRLAERLKGIGMRADRIKLIVEDDTHHKDSWKWFSDNADRLKEKRFTNPSGVLLVHLCIEEPKTKAKGK